MSDGFTNYTWRGEPILDILAWTRERGGEMIRYHAERSEPRLVYDDDGNNTVVMTKEEYDSEMPDVFWNGLAMMHGWHYTELSRYRP